RQAAGEEEGGQKPDDELDVDGEDDEDDGVPERTPQRRISQDVDVVLQADKDRRLPKGRLRDAEPDHEYRRQDDDAQDQDMNRSDQRHQMSKTSAAQASLPDAASRLLICGQ